MRVDGRSAEQLRNLKIIPDFLDHPAGSVLISSGQTRVCGAFVALGLALLKLQPEMGAGWKPLTKRLAAISVGIVKGEVLLDLNYPEDSTADVDMNVVMTDRFELVEIQGTAEEHPFSRQQMSALLDVAEKGVSEILAYSEKEIFQGRLDGLLK